MNLTSVAEIVEDIRQGRMVILVDDEDRENEGDLMMAAQFVTPEAINFMARHGRGLICLTLTEERCRELDLPLMTAANGTRTGTNFTMSIEAAEGVSTGISAADRAHTIQVAVAPESRASDLVKPGHVFPIRARDGGVLMRAGHTEAGCDLTRLAGLRPASVICEIMNDDGTMARMPQLLEFAALHRLRVGTIADLIQHRAATESLVEHLSSRPVDTPYGPFELRLYRDAPGGQPHVALVHGRPAQHDVVPVRVHEPLAPIDLLSAEAGEHAWPVPEALRHLARQECGVLVLLNAAPSAGQVFDAFDRHHRAADARLKPDLRTYGIGAQILRDCGVRRMRLLARQRRIPSMAGYGLDVDGFDEYDPRAPGPASPDAQAAATQAAATQGAATQPASTTATATQATATQATTPTSTTAAATQAPMTTAAPTNPNSGTAPPARTGGAGPAKARDGGGPR